MDREYLAAMQQYNRFLFQRNKMLKDGTFDESLLDVFDERMNEYAGVIHGKRIFFCQGPSTVGGRALRNAFRWPRDCVN